MTTDVGDNEWKGNVGLVTTVLKDLNMDLANAVSIVCGPPIMMKFVTFKLLEYQRNTEAAEELQGRELLGRDVFVRGSAASEIASAAATAGIPQVTFAEVGIFALLEALQDVLNRLGDQQLHEVIRERISIAQKISELMSRMREVESLSFEQLFTAVTSRAEVIALFLALLELIRLRILRAEQVDALGPIHIRRAVPIDEKMLSQDFLTGIGVE